uniref:Uncharacterized protein n=1 Tax=Hucho hucho TaxID=62062 RepID=A0A4W5LUF4_9TELE
MIYKSAGQEAAASFLPNVDLPEPPFPSPPFPGSTVIHRRKKRQAPRVGGSVDEETKYIELMVINDHLMVRAVRLCVFMIVCALSFTDVTPNKEARGSGIRLTISLSLSLSSIKSIVSLLVRQITTLSLWSIWLIW